MPSECADGQDIYCIGLEENHPDRGVGVGIWENDRQKWREEKWKIKMR